MADTPKTIYEIDVRDAQGRARTMGAFRGLVLLIVNTASY